MKKAFSLLLGLLIAAGITVDTANGQTAPKIINGGVVNGKAVSLPKPEYPSALRDSGIEGTVAVNITIDETGSVVSAEAELSDQRTRRAEDGTVLEPAVLDPQLRAAAEAAAMRAKFSPTLLGGSPVSVKGKVVYNFVAKAAVPAEGVASKTVSGGVLNGKATSLPKPVYPPAAQAVKAQGSVSVQITIDEEGKVISASAVSGHPLLRSAAEEAARAATFAPTLLNGQPVRVIGVLTYNFVA